MARPKANYNKWEQQEGKSFCCEIYVESESYDSNVTLSKLPYYFKNFYYCLHDKDVYSEEDLYKYQQNNNGKSPEWHVGDTKKPHFHIVVTKSSNAQLGFIAKQLEIPSNFVQRCKDTKGAIQYLIHLNNPEKYQYQREELITNDDNINKILRKKVDSDEKAEKLFDVICNTEISTITALCKFAIEHNCWDELRRGQHIFSQLLMEKRSYKDVN